MDLRGLRSFSLLLILSGVILVASSSFVPSVAAASQAIYDSIPSPLVYYYSQAWGGPRGDLSQLGEQVSFGGSQGALSTVTVTMNDWACETGSWAAGCLTTPGATYPWPITLNIYAVTTAASPCPTSETTCPTAVTLIATQTTTFNIPYRPSADPTNCPSNPNQYLWAVDGKCHTGYVFNIMFDFTSEGVTLPDQIIFGIAYSIPGNGYGTGPADSLNVAYVPNAPSVGTDVNPDALFREASVVCSGSNCDNVGYNTPGPVNVFRQDLGWATACGAGCPVSLSVEFTSLGTPTPPLNSVYMLSPGEGWAVGDPLILHYDGSLWNTVPAPIFPDSQPAEYNLTSVSFGPLGSPISRSDGWAVGYNGTVGGAACGGVSGTCSVAIHWDGVTWRVQTAGLDGANAGPLWSVSMVSSTDVWAVGENSAGQGVFWHWSGVPGLGGGWNLVQPPVSGPVYSVFMISASEGWAVGSGGAIYHYVGGSWSSAQSPITGSLRSVFMISGTEGWAVGDGGVVIHYVGGTWSGPVSPGTTGQNLVSLFMVSSTEGWAFGLAGTILHYSGGSWTALPANLVPTSPVSVLAFHSAYFNTAGDGWIVGDVSVILHYDGAVFGTVTSPTLNSFTSISFGPPLTAVNPNDGWAVGIASTIAPFEPTIYHWNGFMWTKGVAIGTTNDLYSVFMVNSGDVWAVGGGSHTTASCSASLCPVILHFTGGSWNSVTPPPGSYTIKSIFMLSSDEGWAVGNDATILHYTVSGAVGTWNVVSVSGTPGLSQSANLNSIFMLSPSMGWAVGGIQATGSIPAGPVIIYWDGATWEPVAAPSLPGGIALNSVFFTGPTDGWAVGSPTNLFANILHWDGVSWSLITLTPPPLAFTISPIPPILTSIYMTSAENGWAVGEPPSSAALSAAVQLTPTNLGFSSVSSVTTTTAVTTVTGSTTLISTTSATPSINTTTSTSTVTSSIPPSGAIPGFPLESIVMGLSIGLALIMILRKRRQKHALMY